MRGRGSATSPLVRARRRLVALVAVSLVLVALYSGRLVQLQAVDASTLAEEALDNRLVRRDVPAQRGDILDREGVALATSSERVTITADQRLVATYEDRDDPRRAGPRAAAARLAPVLGVDVVDLTETLTGDRAYVVVARGVDPQTWREVSEMRITGLFREASSARDYPGGELAGSVVGFIGGDGTGLAGVELSHEATLTGDDGWVRYERSGENRGYREIPGGAAAESPPVDGDDVVLTLDRDLQWQAERALATAVADSGATSGSAVVLDATTGEVLALATVPGFDPADVAGPDGVDESALGNSAVSEVYEPGSTSKVMSIAATLEEGVAVPTTPFTVPDTIERGGRTFKDSHPHDILQLTLTGVLAGSSNTGTILATDGLDAEELHHWFSRFGLGRTTGIGLPGESAGILAPVEDWSASQRYTVTFGQGVSVTPLQMASVYQTIANDGVRVPPRIVRGHRTADGAWVAAPEPEAERVLSPSTATSITGMLESVVDDGGTGSSAAVPGYRVAGKTGTAERYVEACGGYCGYTASFAGYAPAEDPRIVVSVAVHDPTVSIFGGTTAAPVFAEIMRAGLAEEHVPHSTQPPQPYPLTW